MWCRLNRVKPISLMLVSLMLWHFAGLRVYAHARSIQTQHKSERPGRAHLKAPNGQFDELLSKLKEVVKQGAEKTRTAPEKGFAAIDKLAELKDRLMAEHQRNQAYFDQLAETIKEKKLGAEILSRHEQFVRQYDTKYQTLIADLEELELLHNKATGIWGKLTGKNKSVEWEGAIAKTIAFLEGNTTSPGKRNFDPQNLPHRALKVDKAQRPKLTREEWAKALSAALAESLDPKQKPSQHSTASKSIAEGGPAGLPLRTQSTAPPTAADLSETIEVKFTPEIRALAESLDKNPVKILNWVRRNIEFVPTWGSIQGAQGCIETRNCNAFDTASLLIALFRVSAIHARYQMGTIEVPIERFKNWAGGFTDADAAASLFASGGVPSVIRRADENGNIVSVKLEHVWVKAFVDYVPSAGAAHRRGDTWVEMDSSFKQHSFTRGVDLETAVPSNLPSLINQALSQATVDPATGSVTNITSGNLRSAIQQTVDQRVSYLRSNVNNALVRDAMGGTEIQAPSLSILPTALPNRVLIHGLEASQLPDTYRHKVTFELESSPDLTNMIRYTANLPDLVGKNVLLLYPPASPADEQALQSIVSSLSDIQSVMIPSSINLTPQLFVGNDLVATGPAVSAGRTITSQISFSSPTISTPIISNLMHAGEVVGIGLDLQGISRAQIEALEQKTQGVATALEQGTFQTLTNRDVASVFLSNNILRWFAMADTNNKMLARSAGVVTIRYPSAGFFFLSQRVNTAFGAPLSSSPAGLGMDIDRDLVVSVSKDGDVAKTAGMTFMQGVFGSAAEADSPVRMLSTPANPVTGAATMQALKIANDQGVPIYQINGSNAATILPLLQIDSEDLVDIQDAVNAGLEAIVSKTPVNFNGRSVLGTIIRDPHSGSASFLISGGTNGSIILLESLMAELGLLLLFSSIAFLVPAALPVLLPIILGMIAAMIITALLLIVELILESVYDFDLVENAHLFNLSPCELIFMILSGLATAIGTYFGGQLGGLLAGSIVSFIIGVIGTEACAHFPP